MREELLASGVQDSVIDDAVLILSELLSNSCRHARPIYDNGGPESHELQQELPQELPQELQTLQGPLGSAAPLGSARSAGSLSSPVVRDKSSDVRSSSPDLPKDGRASAASRGAPRASVRASWRIDAQGRLTVAVTDGGGPTRPLPATPSVTAHGGRGLAIIRSLAKDWGVRDTATGEVTVWAVLSLQGAFATRVDLASAELPPSLTRRTGTGRTGTGRTGTGRTGTGSTGTGSGGRPLGPGPALVDFDELP
ncbi:ATP-binding protein [Streptomyces sp. NPDC001339]|uniref:ATP-binding protein n=1 Tax=Streptomyces sp. NPDC001339 TaxID=3364563 RepID=UPI003686A7EA